MNVGLAKRTRQRPRVVSLVVIALVTVASLIAPAGRALAETELSVTVGIHGQYEVGDQLLVRVSVASDELIDGEIVVTMRNTETTVRRDVQIASGATKVFYFTLPTSWDEPSIDVALKDGNDEVAKKSAKPRQTEDELVGVLPRLAARIGDLPLDVQLGQAIGNASVSALPVEVIDLGAGALRAYDTVVAGGDDLAQLNAAQRETLLTWVSLGGILLLDDDRAVADVPEQWHPGSNGYTWAGSGEVRLTDGNAAGGRWDQIIQPTMIGGPGIFGGSEMMTDPQMDLAGRAGLDLPTIAPLAIGIGLYAVVLGPIVYLVLRKMRRLTLGWFVIPVLAVLTAGGVALAGGGALRNGNPAAATFIQESPGGAYAISNVLTFSSQGGTANVAIPAGWSLGQGGMFWGDGRQTPITITRHSDGTSSATVALEATQANVRSYAGTTTSDGLAVTAVWDGDRKVDGMVTNNTDVALHDVAVFAGEDEALVGELAPGDTAEFTLNAIRRIRFDWASRGSAVWGDPFNGANMVFDDQGRQIPDVDEDDDSMVEFGVWGMASGDVELFPAGMVRVVGWTNAIPSNLIDGDDASTTTAISSLAPVTSDDHAVGVPTMRAQAVRGPFGFNGGMVSDQVFRFVLPSDADPAELYLVDHGNLNIHELAFWDGANWVEADPTEEVLLIPVDAIRDGVVLVKTDVDMNIPQQGIPTLTDQAPEEGA